MLRNKAKVTMNTCSATVRAFAPGTLAPSTRTKKNAIASTSRKISRPAAPATTCRAGLAWTRSTNSQASALSTATPVATGIPMKLTTVPICTTRLRRSEAGNAICDKTAATCRQRYGNLLNFRGEPFLPGADAVLRGASDLREG
jgi:hypothetical protein